MPRYFRAAALESHRRQRCNIDAMRFFKHQEQARAQTRRLLVLFVLTLLLLTLAVNAALALAWWLIWPFAVLGQSSYPAYFFHVNTGLTLLFVLGGWGLEASNLSAGGVKLARRAGARELWSSSRDAEQRFDNIVQELAIAANMKPPTAMVLAREESINAFAAGWDEDDAVVAVTRGALEQLTRDELQGLIAHEFSHIREGDTRLNMHLSGMVFGLEMIFNLGRSMCEPNDEGDRTLLALPGIAIKCVGFLGWLAGRLLRAAVSRQREFLADARAVQFTRSREGLGGVLRKIEQLARADHAKMRFSHPAVLHMLLVDAGNSVSRASDGWLATHPPLTERIFRVYGRRMPPLPVTAQE